MSVFVLAQFDPYKICCWLEQNIGVGADYRCDKISRRWRSSSSRKSPSRMVDEARNDSFDYVIPPVY
jgi:hypothetical protein